MYKIIGLICLISSLHVPLYSLQRGSLFEYEEKIPWDDFNTTKLGSIKGILKDIILFPRLTGFGDAQVAVFNSKFGKIYAILAPEWYLKNQKIEVKKDDRLIIKGSQVNFDNKNVILATEIQLKDKTIKLRDPKTGAPEWSEWRKGEGLFYKNYNW